MAGGIKRREAIGILAVGAGVAAAAAKVGKVEETDVTMKTVDQQDAIIGAHDLDRMHWSTPDPFLFCAHHEDAYPAGDENFGPVAHLDGRMIGQDFSGKDGWSMYHGRVAPGFPQHPHRGFETITIVRRGLIDHADSLGAMARYGEGDVQWLTAGKGINHSEMFPLLRRDRDNPTELFQIWLNLPARSKRADPWFSMFWNADIPRHKHTDGAGKITDVTVIAGRLGDQQALPPPPDSWASSPGSDVAIWTIRMEPGATWTLPVAKADSHRRLYFFGGRGMEIAGKHVGARKAVDLKADREVTLRAGPDGAELLLLQGQPIGEPVVQHGPFVMNSVEEIRQTIADYRRTQFGGWPWGSEAPILPREEGRFAKLIDGKVVRPA